MKTFALVAGTVCISTMSTLAEPTIGQDYRINFADIDGKTLSTADGHMTTLVLVSKANVDKARTVGEHTPDFCLGNPRHRMITVVAFKSNHTGPVRAFLTSVMRRRVASEAKQLQARYERLKIAHDPRQDVFAVADFDGLIAAQLKSKWSTDLFQVFIFGKNGELLKQWNDVPSAEEMAATIKEN
jgi:hypothetical protein